VKRSVGGQQAVIPRSVSKAKAQRRSEIRLKERQMRQKEAEVKSQLVKVKVNSEGGKKQEKMRFVADGRIILSGSDNSLRGHFLA